MNPVPSAIINPRKEYWPSRGSDQQPPVLKSGTLLLNIFSAFKRRDLNLNKFKRLHSFFGRILSPILLIFCQYWAFNPTNRALFQFMTNYFLFYPFSFFKKRKKIIFPDSGNFSTKNILYM